MNLKTLKDLERKQNLDSFICINPIELKQEAIKWIKEMEKISLSTKKSFCLICQKINEGQYCHEGHEEQMNLFPNGQEYYAAENILKVFFNIAEDDLK